MEVFSRTISRLVQNYSKNGTDCQAIDNLVSVWYNDRMNDPDCFIYRLKHTIALLEIETQQGVEDWTPTITRLKEVLAEEMESLAQAS